VRLDAETSRALLARRLRAQRLTGAPCATPEEVVGLLGAVQAQDYGPAKWAVGMRARGAGDDAVEHAFAAGAILRTHVLRPTWHFVLPADIRLLLTATAPRIKAGNAGRYRELGLDEATLRRGSQALVAALRGGHQLTRAEAAAVFSDAGISPEDQRLPYLLMSAELDALVCSGPRRGNQHTYMLLEERAPTAPDPPRDQALSELARRFFTGHGPATEKDFAVWASLTLAEARASLEAATPRLRREQVDGLVFWSGANASPRSPGLRSPVVHLVQGYDEYIMGYTQTKGLLARPGSAWTPATPPVFRLVILLDGRVAGFWKRAVKRDEVIIEAALLEPLEAPGLRALEAAAARYGEFLGLAARLHVAPAAEHEANEALEMGEDDDV
jgi:DNA glycosylase AlkZ-like